MAEVLEKQALITRWKSKDLIPLVEAMYENFTYDKLKKLKPGDKVVYNFRTVDGIKTSMVEVGKPSERGVISIKNKQNDKIYNHFDMSFGFNTKGPQLGWITVPQ